MLLPIQNRNKKWLDKPIKMIFTTPVNVPHYEPRIDHNSKVFLAGSCFVENIGDKFDYYKIPNKRNPTGILYHPFGIRDFIARVVEGNEFQGEDLFFHNERWHCFEAHSTMSDPDKAHYLEKLNAALKTTHDYLKSATHVIITPGTSWVYRRVENNMPVANCHKLPQVNFRKEISKVNEIEDALSTILSKVHDLNPKAQVIFTISPVRHIRDGLVENQLSKSMLFVALHHLISRNKSAYYFPSYEILMDELRDYRFYAEDMLHPGKVGIDYIWQKFTKAWFSAEALLTLREIETIQKGLSHLPFNENSTAHRKFRASLDTKIQAIQSKYSQIFF